MTYENDIPEYALQPARAPKTTLAEAIYNTEKIIYPSAEQTVAYQFEEDILVPDTKPDMREILLMDATADILPAEKKVSPKTDDLLNITGVINIQTIYDSESDDQEPISITSKVPYKYQWSLNPMDQGEGIFSCRVKSLEYMIVNERKFRVKITLEFLGQLFCQREFQFFDGLRDEPLEMKRDSIEMSCLELVKKDEVAIDETFKGKDTAFTPEYILKRDFEVSENYRQVTTEKVVINGFVYISLLYSAVSDSEDGEVRVICQHNQRIEFTQFVPIEKEHRGKKWCAVKTSFGCDDLSVSIETDEENPEAIHFRVKGDIQTRVELYESRQREMIVDAYHRQKSFDCQFSKKSIVNMADAAMAETSIREIINLPEGTKAADAVYCSAKVLDCQCACERGKVVVTGVASCCALWKDQDGQFRTERLVPDFRGTVDMEKITAVQKASCRPMIKTAWVEMINEKQIELNATILLNVETFDAGEVVLLEQPQFIDKAMGKEYPMVIVTMKDKESLWELAKRYRTTEAQILTANNLEAEPEPGRRLLIVK